MLAAAGTGVQLRATRGDGQEMNLLKQLAKATVGWAAANPLKAAQLAFALTLLGATLLATKRLDRRALKRVARIFL